MRCQWVCCDFGQPVYWSSGVCSCVAGEFVWSVFLWNLWCSQVLNLSLLPLDFSLILTVASRLLHLYSTKDKTFRLMMKSFSTVRDTQRGSHSYMEKRRGRREIEVTRSRRGGIKRGESKLASNHFLMCSPQSGSLRDVHRITHRRE